MSSRFTERPSHKIYNKRYQCIYESLWNYEFLFINKILIYPEKKKLQEEEKGGVLWWNLSLRHWITSAFGCSGAVTKWPWKWLAKREGIYSSQFWGLRYPGSRGQSVQFSGRALFQVCRWYLLALSVFGIASLMSLLSGLIPSISAPPSRLNFFPKAQVLSIILLGLVLYHMDRGFEGTYIW